MQESEKTEISRFKWEDMYYGINQDISWRDINGELILLNIKTGGYFTLNDTARIVWLAIMEGKYIDYMVKQIKQDFQEEEAIIISDINKFIVSMRESSLIGEVTIN